MTLLTAQIIGRKIVGVESSVPSRSVYENQPYEPFKAENTISNGYADISSITNWYQFGIEANYLKKDYLYVRNEILLLIDKKAEDTCLGTINDPTTITPNAGDRYCVGDNPVGEFANKQKAIAERTQDNTAWNFLDKDVLGYSLCSYEEKRIAAQLYIGLIQDHKADFGQTDSILWREEYHQLATETRLKRMLAAEALIQQELPAYQGLILLTITSLVTELNVTGTPQLYSIDLHKNYKDFGVKGEKIDFHPIKNPSPAVGIMDYFYGTNLFLGKGLIDMPFIPENMTMQQLCDRVNDILVNGNTLDTLQ